MILRKTTFYIAILLIPFFINGQIPDTIPQLPNKQPKHTLYLIGDSGFENKKGQPAVHTLNALRPILESSSDASSLIFMGDNTMPNGLPSKYNKERLRSERILDIQLSLLGDFPEKHISFLVMMIGIIRGKKEKDRSFDKKNMLSNSIMIQTGLNICQAMLVAAR